MKKLLLAAGVAVLAVCTAGADTLKDGSVSVKPGRWLWKQETSIVGFGSKEENLECLIPEEAAITLSKLARDLQEGCGVENVRTIQGGYLFKLKCKGKISGEADATITHTPTTMNIHAKGSATIAFIPAGFSMKADATYQGECAPDELQRQQQKYAEEQAREAARGGG